MPDCWLPEESRGREMDEKIGRSGPRAPRPTFLVISSCLGQRESDYLRLFLVELLLAFCFGERFAFFALFSWLPYL